MLGNFKIWSRNYLLGVGFELVVLLISASGVSKITGVSPQPPAPNTFDSDKVSNNLTELLFPTGQKYFKSFSLKCGMIVKSIRCRKIKDKEKDLVLHICFS
jgi:hypothetical protein